MFIKNNLFENRVQRCKFLFKCANIFLKKAFGIAQTYIKCAKNRGSDKKNGQLFVVYHINCYICRYEQKE